MTVIKEWIALFESKDYREREALAEHLGKKRSQASFDLLVQLLGDKESLVRSRALEALTERGISDGFKAALPLLKDKNDVVRVNAIECIGALGEGRAVKHLIGMLDDRSSLVRSYAAHFIGDYGNRSCIGILENKLASDKSIYVRVGVLFGLYSLGREEKLTEILRLFKSRQYRVRCSVANNLVGIVDKNNREIILEVLRNASSVEETVAARSSIEAAIKEIS